MARDKRVVAARKLIRGCDDPFRTLSGGIPITIILMGIQIELQREC